MFRPSRYAGGNTERIIGRYLKGNKMAAKVDVNFTVLPLTSTRTVL